MESVILTSAPAHLTGSAIVVSGSGSLAGIFVASASGSPTIAVYDGPSAAAGKVIVNTFTPVAATWYPMPFLFNAGIFVAIGGTVDCTVGTGPVSA